MCKKGLLSVVLFLFGFLTVRSADADFLDNEVEAQCVNNCPLLNRTDKGHYGYVCDYNCNIEQCAKGCKLWKKALGQTCQETCNGTVDRLTPKDLYCVMGCNDAITRYFSQLRSLLGRPPAPALLADSLNSTSLKLEWDFSEAKEANLNCHVQWKYEELVTVGDTWQYCRNSVWDQQDNVFYVDGLQPYTKYRFRIALILPHTGHHSTGEPIVSSESVVISTLPEGLPASPPQNVRATPVDSSSISINWEPGPFPHGPLLSYVLNITDDTDSRHSEVKDIPPDNLFVMVRDVKPLTNYTIEIRMRNKRGSGPPARVAVSTPAEPQMNDMEQPPLILGTDNHIFELTNILGEPIEIYKSQIKLKAMGFHIGKKLLFIIDSDGYVSKIHLTETGRIKRDILKPQNLDFKPLDMSVDWLNNQLYVLGEMKYQISRYIIKRCDLNGEGLTVAYADLNKKPSLIQVDPVNGYLFWTVQDYNKGGLYRLDISDISNGIKHEVKITRILNETELGAFTFEHHNFNILIAYQRLNTIMSVTLDGKGIKNIRTSVTTPKLQKVLSLATANKKFYWTDGDDVFNEEYHEGTKSYFHNTVPNLPNGHYRKVFINLQSSQPWPTPINPPTNVQAIFGRDIAKTRWQPPHLVGLQGKGAWQNWSYEISIKDANSGKIIIHNNINSTFYTITNLKENTDYVLKVAAYTKSGKSPWSSEFRGSTLNASKNPIILWSAAEGLLKSNAAGESMETLIDSDIMRDFYFTDITWYDDQIYLVTNNTHIYWYNMTTRAQGRIVDVDSVGSIAIDWIGEKLYWSNPKKQVIIRSNLHGTEQEPLLISVLAKELNIDSIKAYLYWSTGIKVECAHLNGYNKFEYHDVHYFSGKQVMGLTLDMEEKFVYWIVRGSEGSNLYRAHMQGYWKDSEIHATFVASLQKPNIQGPLCYFHKRLLWLQDDRNAAISDLSGKNIATINGKHMHGLNMVYVVDSSLYMLPDDVDPFNKIIVTPEKIDSRSIRVAGTSDSFNVTWDPVKNINYGTVFYEVQIDRQSRIKNHSSLNHHSMYTTNSTIKYWEHVTPFTPLNVTVRAFTYWAASSPVRAEIYSPPSTPSAPVNLRTFVTFKDHFPFENKRVTVVVRWDRPLHPNGMLRGYKLRCWQIDTNGVEKDVLDEDITMANQTEYKLMDLDKDEVYYFEVQAFTEIGSGTTSKTVSVNTTEEWPIPTLLVATNDSIFLDDIDANSSKTIIDDIPTPVKMAYLMKEKSLFWINQKQELIVYDTAKDTQTKIFQTESKSTSLSLDWLERSLYYVEKSESFGSRVFKIDLNHIDSEEINAVKILERDSKISKIDVSPFTKTIYWLEVINQTKPSLMQSYNNGTGVRTFQREFSHNRINPEGNSCNCSYLPHVGSFSLDHSRSQSKPLIILADVYTQNVIISDKDNCLCSIIAKKSIIENHFPIQNIQSDFGMLYWTNEETLYALKYHEDKLFTKQIKVSDVIIYGQHMQPYPDKKCLSPKQHDNYTVSSISKTSSSLKLRMPKEKIHEDCSSISMATVKYTVYYSRLDEGLNCIATNSCATVVTFNKTKEIFGLRPFTKYQVSVAVSNHFSEKRGVVIGPPGTFQTAPGVPSQPRNVSAVVLNPTLIEVSWLAPEELNGNIVYYEIHWKTDSTVSGVRQKGELSVNDSESRVTRLKLSPDETYTVWVRVYSEGNETSNDSDHVQIRTFPEPSPLVLVNKTAYVMKLSWDITEHVERYTVEFASLTSNEWSVVESVEKQKGSVNFHVTGLKPKRHYKFRMLLNYELYEEVYIWPSDSRFTFETLGDRPSPPGIPIIQYVKPNVYKVYWEASKDNGAPIEEYKLEGKILRFYRDKRSTDRKVPFYNTAPSIEIVEDPEWETFYNGTNTSWIIDGLNEKHKYAFRVSARNSYGWSNTSEESIEFDLNEAARIAEKQNPMKLILIATGVPISICVLVVAVFSYLICSGKKDKQKKLQQIVPIPRAPDVELATLRELPRRGIHNTNILYVSTQPTPEELTHLPHIRRDQITLNKFLGSGAFGEVFEGKAKGIGENNIETRVAVKTLKKGASDQEKTEFLQEAQLMSHFKHEHILQLLGVCLDNDPHFIIMELMEGGDLLTYLRDSRNPTTNTPALSLIELLKMCVDVSKGCRYLEEMHFVHRDLACRNCLVSSYTTDSRIVKIGDFGLARDIYKNDYYRKEGEGLLPVRWMAPESLVDGVFTSQSDVWAFGVLLWEIMTLGQQPYPARANLEVLHYVRTGGRLGKPMDCPEELHKLMLKCWEYEPEKRPTFKYCLEVLDNLHTKTLRNPSTGAHEGQYISTIPELFAGISNAAYYRDENHNSSGNSWKMSDTEEDAATKEMTPFLSQGIKEIPKYLELVYEPEPPLENDGYEIPTQLIPKTNF